MTSTSAGRGSRRVFLKRNMKKCPQCRHDHKLCLPTDRQWPDKCERCKEKDRLCGESCRAPRENQRGSRSGPPPRRTAISPQMLRVVAPANYGTLSPEPIFSPGSIRWSPFDFSIPSSEEQNVLPSTSFETPSAHEKHAFASSTLLNNHVGGISHTLNATCHHKLSDLGLEADFNTSKQYLLLSRLLQRLRTALDPQLEYPGSGPQSVILALRAKNIISQLQEFSISKHKQGFSKSLDGLRQKGNVEKELKTIYASLFALETSLPAQAATSHDRNNYHQFLALIVQYELEAKRYCDACFAHLKLSAISSLLKTTKVSATHPTSPEATENWCHAIITIATQLSDIWKEDQAGLTQQHKELSLIVYPIPPAHLVILLDLGDQVLARLFQGAPQYLSDQDLLGHTPLHLAIKLSHHWAIERSLKSLPNCPSQPDKADDLWRTPILTAARQGDLLAVMMLHCAGASKTTADPDGCGVLEAAVESENAELVRYVLSQLKLPPSGEGGVVGPLPIHRAARKGLTDIFKILVQYGAKFLEFDCYDGFKTALHQAKEHGHRDLVIYLEGLSQDWDAAEVPFEQHRYGRWPGDSFCCTSILETE